MMQQLDRERKREKRQGHDRGSDLQKTWAIIFRPSIFLLLPTCKSPDLFLWSLIYRSAVMDTKTQHQTGADRQTTDHPRTTKHDLRVQTGLGRQSKRKHLCYCEPGPGSHNKAPKTVSIPLAAWRGMVWYITAMALLMKAPAAWLFARYFANISSKQSRKRKDELASGFVGTIGTIGTN